MKSKPKILAFDIETSPMLVWTHYIGRKVSINPQQIEKDSHIICIGYSWVGSSKIDCIEWDENQDDSKMLIDFNDIAKDADLLLGHNGRNFDVKEIRTHIALRGLADAWCETPCLDTLKDYRRYFRMKSNRLDAIARSLGLGHKDSMCFQDWIDVVKGDDKALQKMVKYCKKDVKLLKDVYKRLDPYIPPSNMSMIEHIDPKYKPEVCYNCGGKDIIKQGIYSYKNIKYQKYLCKSCFKILKPTDFRR